MTVTYHSGRRIQGTQADFDGTPAVAGGWKELGRTTLGSDGDSIDVSSLADKRYLMFLLDSRSNGTAISTTWKANGSTGNEYSFRRNHDGTEGYATTQPSAATSWTSIVTNAFGVGYAANKSGKEKLFLEHEVYQNTAGAGNAPTRTENTFKWTGTDVIDQLTMHNSDSGDIVSGSELVILGYDPDDTHTTNFWEELDTTTISSAGELDTGSFTAKKYLWIQYSCNSTDGGFGFRFNSDTGTNYARRFSQNGAADQTELSYNMMRMIWSGANTYYGNMFIINNSANEKLVINHQAGITATGAGTAPYRWETAGKWANTSSQITSVQFLDHADASGFIDSGTVKVWGSN